MKTTAAKPPISFYRFCLAHRAYNTALGDLASVVASDPGAPHGDEALRTYLLTQLEGHAELVSRLWEKYLAEKRA